MKYPVNLRLVVTCLALATVWLPCLALGQDTSSAEAELAEAQAENAKMAVKVAELEAALAQKAAMVNEHQAMTELNKKMLAVLQQESQQLRQQMAALQDERDNSQKSVVDLTDQLQKAFAELKRLKEENARLAAVVPAPPNGVSPPPKVEGLVLGVASGGLVEISIGTDDGLKAGHRLTVFREAAGKQTQLGLIDVLQASKDKAICRVDTKSAQAEIAKGDRVTTGNLAAPPVAVAPGAPPLLVGGEVVAVGENGEIVVSFGASDGVAIGHRLEVYRLQGAEGIYVAQVEVVRPAAKTSVCKAVQTMGSIRKGDRVTSKL